MTTDSFPRTGAPPEHFGRYRILKKLGEGGLGVVHLAHDPDLNRLVALKTPRRTDAAESFRRAARVAASLHHPNICPLYEAGAIDGTPYLTMAYIDGTTLAERLRLGRLPAAEAATLVRTVALALAEAHDGGVIHRDVKPSNILINRRGEPILTDFSLSAVGTPAYLAPERIRGESLEDGRAGDIYSLGVVFYELLTGSPLFEDSADCAPDLDPRFGAVCRTAAAKNPTERYPDMAAFAAALAPLAAAPAEPNNESWSLPLSSSGEKRPVTSGENSSKSPAVPPHWPWRLVAGLAACCGVFVAASFCYIQIKSWNNIVISPSPASTPSGDAPSAEVHLARASAYLDENDMGPAVQEANAALQFKPGSAAALAIRSRAEHREGMEEAADADCLAVYRESQRNPKDAPHSAREYAGRAGCFLRIDKGDEALADCTAAVHLDPNCTTAWLLSAQVWHNRGRPDAERQTYADAWRIVRPTTAAHYADLARITLALDRTDDALQCCKEAAWRDPKSSDAFEAWAQTWRRKGGHERAADAFARAAALLHPRWARDYVESSILHELAGDADRALADAGRALELAPRLSAAFRQRGAAFRAQKNRAAAAADFRAAIRTPRFAADYFDRAWLFNELGDHKRAADDLERSLALGLRSGEVHRELAHAYRRLGESDRAAAHLDAAFELLPADALLYSERGALALAAGRYGDAVRAYSEVLARTAPADHAALADLYDRRGVAFVRLEKYAEAAADYSRAIDNDPADPVLYRNRAAALIPAGDDEAADADVRKAE